MRPLLGAHMPMAGGLGAAVRAGAAIGCEALQVFTSSPQQWKAKPITDKMVEDFQKAKQTTGLNFVVSHDSYLVNLSSPDPDLAAKSFEGLLAETRRCEQYGISYVVSHMGSHKERSIEDGLTDLIEATKRLLDVTPDSVMILMETTAGQGTSLNYRFEQLGRILNEMGPTTKLGVCLDTCHIFAAGYDIRTDEGYDMTWQLFELQVGLQHLKVIHCNDSKKPLGSRVDRHADIGEGEIGIHAFDRLVNDPRFGGIPVLLETPDAPEGHIRNLNVLRGLLK
jgi:deoxyribonuclease-4